MTTDVLVVGAGPVGLLLAAELRLAGASPLVLEQSTAPSGERRARGVGPLAAEALQRRGLGPLLAAHHPRGDAERAADHGSEKHHFAWIHKIDPALQEEPGRRGVLIRQPDLEAILREYAAGLGVAVRNGHVVTALAQDEEGVTVTADTPGGIRRFRAPYAVGCDGGRSTVRKLAGFEFHGTPPTMIARHAEVDLEGAESLPPSGRTPAGTLFHTPGLVGTFDFDLGDAPADRTAPVTREEMQASLRRVSGTRVTVTRIGSALRVSDHARQVSTYRRGRVLLAGDAAHVHSPNGGQGLNLGLMDAANLGWKLAAEVRGEAPEGLLDSYTRERRPVGAAVLHNTRAQSALMRPGPHTDALRDIVSDLMDLPEVNRYFGRMMSGLATRYTFPYMPSDAHPLVGRHCPDLELAAVTPRASRTVRLSRLTPGGGTVLLAPAGSRVLADAAPWQDRLAIVEASRVDRDDLSAALIRPDGVVAWAAAPDLSPDGSALTAALGTWLGAPH
ncbi:FAD-dependent monooxygenase [Streptomyces fuscigenes]|uniref:FAD-dependent monooxygenase n=1 Tax=Streptomyces fuscigenes TaxID=1528880 RepID=UPI001F26E3DB|nr:FAD-dependent monooxygenase [Streptomyces fuscigenes]MCF3960357.1 FAD-dependent monooxygenase [Streptomyces fuscigenes]